MESIKWKMVSLAQTTEEAEARAAHFSKELARVNAIADDFEEQIRTIHKKIQSLEGQFDTCSEQLFDVTNKLEVKEKALGNAEGEVGGVSRRALLLEEEDVRSEDRLGKAISELARISQRADQAIKKRQQLENLNAIKEEECDKLESQLKEDKFTLADSEMKYDDIARKMHGREDEMFRSGERCAMGESKIVQLEEELMVVGQNLQTLEVSEEKALKREENYQNQIRNLRESLKAAENREENALMNMQRLNIRIDQVEEDLLAEKIKIKHISDDLDKTFDDMIKMRMS